MSIGSEMMEEHYERNVIPRYKEEITDLREYVKFLEEECGRVSQIAAVHGWRCPDETFKKGEDFRAKLIEYVD